MPGCGSASESVSDAGKEDGMRRAASTLLGVVAAAGCALATAAPAGAQTTGDEAFKGVIVASGASGTREVISSVVVAKGVFDGVGRIVEVPNLPGDPDNVVRDDLVFASGTIHIVTTNLDFSLSLNPRSCRFNASLQQTSEVVGGTGLFAAASGSSTATVNGQGLLARNPDGSCSFEQDSLHEVDMFASTGSLSF
jgi:hypothetical protein